MADKKLIAIAVLLLAWSGYSSWSNRWMDYEPGAISHQEPLQQTVTRASFAHKGFTVTPVASFNIEARILSKARYYWGKESKLVPIDYALGWGPMAQDTVIKKLKISQSNRWYHYRYKTPPILESEIHSHSGNMHLIPANKDVLKLIKKARPGQVVRLSGFLVNVTEANGWHWNSSLSRTDSGGHSCELFWVDEMVLM